jgi:hypothetical protein
MKTVTRQFFPALLRVLEENLRSFEKYRQLILDQLKKTDRQG